MGLSFLVIKLWNKPMRTRNELPEAMNSKEYQTEIDKIEQERKTRISKLLQAQTQDLLEKHIHQIS